MALKARLDSKVGALRGNSMTFQNEGGAEIKLSVPDTAEVKDTFGTLVTTIAGQQDQIVLLQATMKQMALDQAKAQADMIAWTTRCVQELKAQNSALQEKLADANLQIDNFAYNMQGFVDGSRNDVKTTTSSSQKDIQLIIRPPTVSKTKIPIGKDRVGDLPPSDPTATSPCLPPLPSLTRPQQLRSTRRTKRTPKCFTQKAASTKSPRRRCTIPRPTLPTPRGSTTLRPSLLQVPLLTQPYPQAPRHWCRHRCRRRIRSKRRARNPALRRRCITVRYGKTECPFCRRPGGVGRFAKYCGICGQKP